MTHDPIPLPTDAALRLDRGGKVLALGILSLATALASICVAYQGFTFRGYSILASLVALLIGLLAIVVGWRQIAGMRKQQIDPAGRRKTRMGQALATAAVVLAALLTTFLIVYFPRDHSVLFSDGTFVVTEMYYRYHLKAQYSQVLGPNGQFVREGPYVGWRRSGKKFEEGSYHEGKRDGQWRFWNENGSIDEERSGLYEEDKRIGPSPMGDFPVDQDR